MTSDMDGGKEQPNGRKRFKGEMIAAVDIGSSKVCTVLANITPQSIQIQGTGIYPAHGFEKGLVSDIDQAGESIRQSIKRAEQSSGEVIDCAYVGIPGTNITSAGNRGVVAVDRKPRPVRPRDVKRVLASAREVDIPQERRLLHVIPAQYTVDGQSGVKDPVGMQGFRLDVDSHIVTVPSNAAENIIKCAHKAGLRVKGLVLQALACGYVALHPDEIDAGVVVVDIGAGTTGIAAFKDGSVMLTSVLPIGGYNITRDLAVGIGLPFDVVETLKKQHADLRKKDSPQNGSNRYEEDDQDQYITINYEGLNTIHRQDFNEIVRARVEEIMKLVVSQLPPHRAYIANFPAGLVIAGGSANLPGIESVAQDVTGLPARVAKLSGLTGLADPLYDPAFVSTVGLLLCGGKWGQDQRWLREGVSSRFADTVRSLGRLVPRVKIYHS